MLVASTAPAHALTAPEFLIGSRTEDPDFAQSIVLLLQSGAHGAMGLIVNVRTEVRVGELFPGLKTPAGAAPLYKGGPVRQGVNGLVRSRVKLAGASAVFGDVYLIPEQSNLKQRLAEGAASSTLRIYVGLCGWSAGQLGNEILAGVWRTAPPDASVIFDPHPETVWQRITARLKAKQVARAIP